MKNADIIKTQWVRYMIHIFFRSSFAKVWLSQFSSIWDKYNRFKVEGEKYIFSSLISPKESHPEKSQDAVLNFVNKSLIQVIWHHSLSRLLTDKIKSFLVTRTKSFLSTRLHSPWAKAKRKSLREGVIFI